MSLSLIVLPRNTNALGELPSQDLDEIIMLIHEQYRDHGRLYRLDYSTRLDLATKTSPGCLSPLTSSQIILGRSHDISILTGREIPAILEAR